MEGLIFDGLEVFDEILLAENIFLKEYSNSSNKKTIELRVSGDAAWLIKHLFIHLPFLSVLTRLDIFGHLLNLT